MRRPSVLAAYTWAYLLWWLVPVLVAVRVTFTENPTFASPTGFTLGWYRAVLEAHFLREALVRSVVLATATTLLATPLGTLLAVGLYHLRGRASVAGSGLLAASLLTPQVAMATALFFLFGFGLFAPVPLDLPAQVLGHVTLALPFVALILGIRLWLLGRDHEEMAMDLGASPAQAFRDVTLPLLVPAVVIAAVVAFVLSFDNIVVSQWLCIPERCRTFPVLLYGGGRGDPGPVHLAMASTALGISLVAIGLGAWGFRLARARVG